MKKRAKPDDATGSPPPEVSGWEVVRFLGRGAMGSVYEVLSPDGETRRALKLLHPKLVENQDAVRRFRREMAIASRIRHEHAVRFFQTGEAADGTPFLIMELVEGRDLAQVLQSEGHFPWRRVARLAVQMAEALAAAHALGIIHRDLKPSNVMVLAGTDDEVKVCDFGVAKITRAEDTSVDASSLRTGPGLIAGTPAYMSPEQIKGSDIDGRADIYSLCAMMYQMLTGSLPFRSSSTIEMLSRQLTENPEPPRTRRPDLEIPEDLEALIMSGLAKVPEQRPADARLFAKIIEAVASGQQVPAFPRLPENGKEPPTVDDATWSMPLLATKERRRYKVGLGVLGGVAALAALGIGGGLWLGAWRTSAAPKEQAETSIRAPGSSTGTPPHRTSSPVAMMGRVGPVEPSLAAAAPKSDKIATPTVVVASAAEAMVTNTALASPPPKGRRRDPALPGRVHPAPSVVSPGVAPASRSSAIQPAAGSSPRRTTAVAEDSTRVAPLADERVDPPKAEDLARGDKLAEVLRIAAAWMAEGRLADACAFLERVEPAHEGLAPFHAFLGKCYMRLGRIHEAKQNFRRYLQLAPNAPDAPFIRSLAK